MTLDYYRHQDLAAARSWASLQPEERLRRAKAAARDRDAKTLWELTVAHHERRHRDPSRETLRKYRLGAQRWLDYTASNAVSVLHPEPDQAELWVRQMENEQLAPASVGVYLAGARALYAALRWTRATSDDPFRDVKPGRDKRNPWDKRQPYSEADLARLLSATQTLEMRVLLRLGAVAGLRASEIIQLRWNDLDLDDGTVRVLGKGRKMRRVLLAQSLVVDLRELQLSACGELVIGRSTEAARLRVRTLCKHANVPYLALHPLRHAAGTRLIRAGFALQDVAEHLGHADVQTARLYAKWADDRLRAHMREL